LIPLGVYQLQRDLRKDGEANAVKVDAAVAIVLLEVIERLELLDGL
jgi:hypothetical protein